MFYAKRSVYEQMDRLPIELQDHYQRTQLDRIEIDGEVIQGYFEYSFMEEKSYVEQPTRSIDGTIEGIDDYVTFLTPRIIIKYNMMAIEDYRLLMKKLKSKKNSFDVTCYDIVEDKRVTHNMYFAPPSMPIIYQQYLMALGVQEYTIELIGTNKKPTLDVLYDFNLIDEEELKQGLEKYSQNVNLEYNQTNVIGNISVKTLEGNELLLTRIVPRTLIGWNTEKDGSGFLYKDGGEYYISRDLILYAQWGEKNE